MSEIRPGSRVRMHFRLALEDGTEADSSFGDDPLEFCVGDGTLVHSLEQLLLGLAPGAHERFLLGPEEAFGPRDPDNVQAMDRAEFDPSLDLAPGTVIGFSTPAGDEVAGTVVEADAERVLVDFNHPLAGRNLLFEVKVLEVG